jgi:hypothetical protein
LSTVRADAASLVVSVDWQRLWDRGQRLTNGPSGTVQLTLHPGDRIPLDHIPNAAASEACRAVGMGLEVKVARTTTPEPVNSALLPLGAVQGSAAGTGRLSADLWLVHRLPTGVEQAHHQVVRLPADGAPFGFAPVTVATSRGDVNVEVSGSFRRFQAATGGEFLYVSMVRTVTGDAMPPGGIRGGTMTVIPQPGPAEVLSLEMPGLGGGGGAVARGGGIRSGGGASPRSGGGMGAGPTPPGPQRSGGGGGGAVVGSGSGGGPVDPAAVGRLAAAVRTLGLLAGHTFSVRVRLTPE